MSKAIHIFFAAIVLAMSVGAFEMRGADFKDETLHYVITYKWGLITKDSGDATLSLRRHGDVYNLKITGKTRPWADKFYRVRDTLTATVRAADFRPLSYTRAAHEGNSIARDRLTYSYETPGKVEGSCQRYKEKKGTITEDVIALEGAGPTYDMLSVFYYLRLLDYATLEKNKVFKLTMFSGSNAENVTIRSLGKETITLRGKKKVEAYHIRFRFTQKGGKKSSDDIDAWISADDKRLPLLLEGSLSIGKITCHFID